MSRSNTLTPPERVRLNLELSKQVYDQMQTLQKRSDATSLTEVIRRALALYDVITEHVSDGGKIVLRDKDGNDENVRLV
jgi:hypothetical protein